MFLFIRKECSQPCFCGFARPTELEFTRSVEIMPERLYMVEAKNVNTIAQKITQEKETEKKIAYV